MQVLSDAEVIKNQLVGPSFTDLSNCLRESIYEIIALVASQAINADSCDLSPNWDKLDDPLSRNHWISTRGALESCAQLFIQRHLQSIKDAFSASFLRIPSTKQLIALLDTLVPSIVNGSPSLVSMIAANPFPEAWMKVAHKLSLSAVHLYGAAPKEEWKRLNRLLLAEYFHGCMVPNARLVKVDLHQFSLTILGIRGCLLRIPGAIDRDGLADAVPPLLSAAHGPPTPSLGRVFARWSELFGYIDFETENIQSGRGIVHRILDENRPVPPESVISVSHSQMVAFRDKRFREIEFSVIGYMALCGIEQLLRAWASNKNIVHMSGQEPISWNEWKMQVAYSPGLLRKLEILYDPDGPNIRNRIMHGGLLELESKRTESLVGAVKERQFVELFPVIDLSKDHFSCENISNLCLDCLTTLQQEIQSQGIVLTDEDRTWETSIMLTEDDIKFGSELYCDFLDSPPEIAERLRKLLFTFLGAATPVFSLCAQVGFHGWIRHQWVSDVVIQHMFLGLTFEGLYRLTVHLLGFSVLQESNKNGMYRAKYRMLTGLPGGIFNDNITNRLVAHLSPGERETAKKVLCLAINARDALAHGAIHDHTIERRFGEGHLFIKSIQLLQQSAVQHLISEAAYFNWLHRHRVDNKKGSDLSDWIKAEDQITNLILRYSR